MPNMSYCRFRNTEQELKDCLCAIDSGEYASAEERKAAHVLLEYFLGWCQDMAIIEDFNAEELENTVARLSEDYYY
jgi:hypothetical protein